MTKTDPVWALQVRYLHGQVFLAEIDRATLAWPAGDLEGSPWHTHLDLERCAVLAEVRAASRTHERARSYWAGRMDYHEWLTRFGGP